MQTEMSLGGWTASPEQVMEHALTPEMESQWPQHLTDFVTVVASGLERHSSMEAAKAQQMARVAVSALAMWRGGRIFYLPTGEKLQAALRDQAMWMEYNGKNITELAQKYKMIEPSVYRILARQRQLHTRKLQPSLF